MLYYNHRNEREVNKMLNNEIYEAEYEFFFNGEDIEEDGNNG